MRSRRSRDVPAAVEVHEAQRGIGVARHDPLRGQEHRVLVLVATLLGGQVAHQIDLAHVEADRRGRGDKVHHPADLGDVETAGLEIGRTHGADLRDELCEGGRGQGGRGG